MAVIDYRDELDRPLILPADVLVFPVAELAEHVRNKLDFEEGDFAVTRPNSRSYSRIISPDTAVLLREFRRPTPLIEGILRYSVKNDRDPFETLDSSFTLLQTFSAAAFLVPEDSPLAKNVAASYAPGRLCAGYEIRRLVRVLEDTEVYQVVNPDGEIVALKVARFNDHLQDAPALRREAEILQHLDGACSPRFLEHGVYQDRDFIAMSWLSGVPIIRRAAELREARQNRWRQELHGLCLRLLESYCMLHEHGVIHGDVHTHNVFVDREDSLKILDYGLSRVAARPDLDHNERSGLAWFMEPELAAAMLSGLPLPPATFKGEQYSIAALIYYLICGQQYLTAVPEKEALLQQALDSGPPPFPRHGFEGWPAVEAVLARAMAKVPQDRFASMAAFRDAFATAKPPGYESFTITLPGKGPQRWLEEMLSQAAFQPEAYRTLFPERPTASAYFGATGLIWFLYRAAQIREEPRLLDTADLWSRLLLDQMEHSGGFGLPGDDQHAPASLYLGRPGLLLISALASNMRGDGRFSARQVRDYIQTSRTDNDELELLSGAAGTLAGGAMLLDALSWSGRQNLDALAQFVNEQSGAIENRLCEQPAIAGQGALPHLGIAHGWAGVLYALISAYRSLKRTLPESVYQRLDELAALAELDGRGVCWQGTIHHSGLQGETPGYAPGWCSGSAGHVYLWALAAETLNDARYSCMAEKAAWFAWEHADRGLNLCCGLTGRAFALLRCYRHCGNEEWLERARVMAHLTTAAVSDNPRFDDRPFSLFRGALGPATLALELERPQSAVMPLFETEGWPHI